MILAGTSLPRVPARNDRAFSSIPRLLLLDPDLRQGPSRVASRDGVARRRRRRARPLESAIAFAPPRDGLAPAETSPGTTSGRPRASLSNLAVVGSPSGATRVVAAARARARTPSGLATANTRTASTPRPSVRTRTPSGFPRTSSPTRSSRPGGASSARSRGARDDAASTGDPLDAIVRARRVSRGRTRRHCPRAPRARPTATGPTTATETTTARARRATETTSSSARRIWSAVPSSTSARTLFPRPRVRRRASPPRVRVQTRSVQQRVPGRDHAPSDTSIGVTHLGRRLGEQQFTSGVTTSATRRRRLARTISRRSRSEARAAP